MVPITEGVTLVELWATFEFAPNDAQRNAISHDRGPLFLPAGPGSGKTRVLLWRALRLIVFEKVPPERIFISTFTEKAAAQLKTGLQTLLAAASNRTGVAYDTSKLYVGTVHALCQRILSDRRFYRDRGRGTAPTLLDDLDQYLFIARRRTWDALVASAFLGEDPEPQINGYFRKQSRSRHEAITSCISLFNRLSEESINPAEAIQQAESDRIMSGLLRMYGTYLEALREAESTDFSLLQRCAYDVLMACDNAGEVFDHVIVDEYQDTNNIQEQIFFRLASVRKNLCVVGDDDQALYRFRGATVHNFVEFQSRCKRLLGVEPMAIPLVKNYRSRHSIVDFCRKFLDRHDWRKDAPATGYHRIAEKEIESDRKAEQESAVVVTDRASPANACGQIAKLVRELVDLGVVQDPNEVAFLYPSLKSPHVLRMIAALEVEGFKAYAPRATTFIECSEATAVFGLFCKIFGRPSRGTFGGSDYRNYHDWLDKAERVAASLITEDPNLASFVKDRQQDVQRARNDYSALLSLAAEKRWPLDAVYKPALMKREIATAPGLSAMGKRSILHPFFEIAVQRREKEGRPFPLDYILKRASSIDWSILDLFYRCCGFKHFIAMYDAAERELNPDEGPLCNLGLVSDYLSRFMSRRVPIITGQLLRENGFANVLFGSYLYALYRLGESEYENTEDPFPKGRVPFLTVHQSKGLEFPVVVLGNLRKDDNGPQRVEELVRPFLGQDRKGEPLQRVAGFDIMRLFYVALSRAENLLVLAHYTGPGQRSNAEFRHFIDNGLTTITGLDLARVPASEEGAAAGPRGYSYTSDFLAYKRCPRQYLIFRRLAFAPSRSQTMLFGTLVHRTLDDLHQYLIAGKEKRRDAVG